MNEKTQLRRTLGFWALVAYGVGDILGAGIYALVGSIAGTAGSLAWVAFAVAMGVAALTALSYAELGRRFPRSGGEAFFCQTAFGWPKLSLFIGWLVFCSGVVSLSTITRAFADYLLATWPEASPMLHPIMMAAFLLLLTGINFWGIRTSSNVNIVCTLTEVSGLVIVLIAGALFLMTTDHAAPVVAAVAESSAADLSFAQSSAGSLSFWLIVQGAALAFFAFIGFEDMVNVSEEVREPERNLPRAIIVALLLAGSLYIVVTWMATRIVPPAILADAQAPLLAVVQRAAPAFPSWIFVLIALFAVANTGLLNYVMGSRLLYGMAQQRLLPRWLALVHPRTQTPYAAILVILAVTLVLSLSGTIRMLAGTTSFLLLIVFCAVNAALVAIKYGERKESKRWMVSCVVPCVAAMTSFALVFALPAESAARASIVIALGLVLMMIHRSATKASDATQRKTT